MHSWSSQPLLFYCPTSATLSMILILPLPAIPYHFVLPNTNAYHSLFATLYTTIPCLHQYLPLPTTLYHYPCHLLPLPTTRYQQEETEKRVRLERQHRATVERQRRERVAEEASLRDKLIRNVEQLEQQRKEIQRELVLRDMSGRSSSSQRRRSRHDVPSAVVVPRH